MWRWIALLFAAPLYASTGQLKPLDDRPNVSIGESTWTGNVSVDVETKEGSIVIDAKTFRIAGSRGTAKWVMPYEHRILITDEDMRLGVLLYHNRNYRITLVGELVGTKKNPCIRVLELKFLFREQGPSE